MSGAAVLDSPVYEPGLVAVGPLLMSFIESMMVWSMKPVAVVQRRVYRQSSPVMLLSLAARAVHVGVAVREGSPVGESGHTMTSVSSRLSYNIMVSSPIAKILN